LWLDHSVEQQHQQQWSHPACQPHHHVARLRAGLRAGGARDCDAAYTTTLLVG
jgi:hypothetical protein